MDPACHLSPQLAQPLAEHAREFARGGKEPAVPQDAATTVLLRPGASGLEVYLLRRQPAMQFAPGVYAFPGGRVDRADHDPVPMWAGPSPARWAGRLACAEGLAQALVCAAVRETFEETGVLLAGSTADNVVGDLTGSDWEEQRCALVERSLSLPDFLARNHLVLRTDLLQPWAHWITPVFEPRRYDTRFFVAPLPAGQQARDVSGEADETCWLRPGDVVTAADAGELALLPPTYVTLNELAGFSSVDAVLLAAEARRIATVLPELEVAGDQALLRLPEATP